MLKYCLEQGVLAMGHTWWRRGWQYGVHWEEYWLKSQETWLQFWNFL